MNQTAVDKEAFRDSIATVDKAGKRVWVYPKKPAGKLYRYRKWVSYGFLALLFAGPFLKINDLPVLMENWYAAGAMYSTVDDVGRFADALYEGRLLRPGTLDAMLTPGLDEYGYGLWIWDQRAGDRSFRAAVRFGGVMGANAVLYRILDEDITIVILGNTNASDMGDFAHRIATTLLN